MPPLPLREQAEQIWHAAVAAARPEELVRAAFADPGLALLQGLLPARRILVVGAGKAGAGMSAGLEEVLAASLDRMEGIVNVPAESVVPLRKIRLHAARPAGTNQPTAEGVEGTRQVLDLLAQAAADDVAICLLSGGASALLPAPVPGVTLEDKQQVTRLLHASGATINEMNAVRKHLSLCKGGGLARAFRGSLLFTLIISDVVGDPLDVIGSGPTAADPTTFADALAILEKYRSRAAEMPIPERVLQHLRAGASGLVPETLKVLPEHVHNYVIGNNARCLRAAEYKARELGFRVLNLGSYIEGETTEAAVVLCGILRSLRAESVPMPLPVCVLSGGETTVTLAKDHGRGGRNQEFVLASLIKLGEEGLHGAAVLSGGTDGEDGPTDAAGAVADEQSWAKARQLGLVPQAFLDRHDAYAFFEATGDLLKTGLTQTNVMDVRVMLLAPDTPVSPMR